MGECGKKGVTPKIFFLSLFKGEEKRRGVSERLEEIEKEINSVSMGG